MARRIRTPRGNARPRLRIGVRVWLATAFALVAAAAAAAVSLFVSGSSEDVLERRASDLAVGRTVSLADRIGTSPRRPGEVIRTATDAAFSAWYFNSRGVLVAPNPPGPTLLETGERGRAITQALAGRRFRGEMQEGDVTVVATPVFGETGIEGVVLGRQSLPRVLDRAIEDLREDSLQGFALAVAVAIAIGALVATLIAVRVKRLVRGAEGIASGRLDVPLEVSGRDEVGDLARSLDSMRAALKESFDVLSSERDKLSTIFQGLTDAVIVVEADGAVRFSNPAAEPVLDERGEPIDALVPYLRQAAERGQAGLPALRVGRRVYAVQARDLPAERAVLVVVRDRTEELRREEAEREFVSNAAHELRNPLAGISGAIEVLQAGAKDDPEARDHFLERLSDDVERMSRLTQALLTLARVDTVGAEEAEVVDVATAADDAAAAIDVPDGIELEVDVEAGLCAKAHPTLVRQVLIGLLSNACKNTPAPGTVSLRGRRESEEEVMLEVIDTGTGIPAAEVERVFERFYRRSGSQDAVGFGLGLAIARRMVDVMGGRIGATSEEGKGSTFWVRLPQAEPSPTPVA